jgi:hypothetical protein
VVQLDPAFQLGAIGAAVLADEVGLFAGPRAFDNIPAVSGGLGFMNYQRGGCTLAP